MEGKKTIKKDFKVKDVMLKEGKLVEFESGETVNLMKAFKDIFEDEPFTISCSAKTEEILEVDDEEEE